MNKYIRGRTNAKKYHLGDTTGIINSGKSHQCMLKLAGESTARNSAYTISKYLNTRHVLMPKGKKVILYRRNMVDTTSIKWSKWTLSVKEHNSTVYLLR